MSSQRHRRIVESSRRWTCFVRRTDRTATAARAKQKSANHRSDTMPGSDTMNVSDHTTRVFDSDLIKLTQLVARMGGLAQKQVTDSIDALARRDTALARQVID